MTISDSHIALARGCIKEAQSALDSALAFLTEDVPPVKLPYLTDRVTYQKPAPIALGPAGFAFTDPTFGAKIWRVTDPTSNFGSPCRTPSSIGGAWNTDGTKFAVVGSGGNAMFYAFDGAKVTPLSVSITAQNEPWFSYVDPNLVYGAAWNPTTGSYRLIRKWNIGVPNAAGQARVDTVVDLDALYQNLPLAPGGYCGPVSVVDNDVLAVLFGGAAQDAHLYIHHTRDGLCDASRLTFQATASRFVGARLHGFALDRTGRLILAPSGAELSAHPGLALLHLWDQATKNATPLQLGNGHSSYGYGQMVNQDCCSASTWDAAQWQFRNLEAPTLTKDLIAPVLLPKSTWLSEHSPWRNARPDRAMPVLSSTFLRVDTPAGTPWRAWDDEIVTIATDGSGVVARHCHHQALQTGDYWDQPNAHISPDGRYAIFTSNWGRTVGPNRQDVFLVQLGA